MIRYSINQDEDSQKFHSTIFLDQFKKDISYNTALTNNLATITSVYRHDEHTVTLDLGDNGVKILVNSQMIILQTKKSVKMVKDIKIQLSNGDTVMIYDNEVLSLS